MKARALLVTGLLVAAGVPAAHAETVQPGSYAGSLQLVAGPVLAGDRIAWAARSPAEPTSDGRRWATRLYSAPAAGGAAQALAEIGFTEDDGSYPQGNDVLSLAGSSAGLAWSTYQWDASASKYGYDYPDPYRVTVLRPGGVPELVCRTSRQDVGFALDAGTLAVSGCGGVTVRELGGEPATLAAEGGPVRLAGRYAAWRTAAGFEVLDRESGARTTFDAAGLPGRPEQFAISAEGMLVVAVNTLVSRIAWASPADPAWHVSEVPGLYWASELRVAGGRIALLRGNDALELADPAGARTVAVPAVLAASGSKDFDFDGTSVAWASDRCGALVVQARRVADGPAPAEAVSHCPVMLDPRPLRRGKRNTLVRLRCPAPSRPRPTDSCAGTVTVRSVTGRRLGTGRFIVAPGGRGVARVRLAASRAARVQVSARSVTRGHVTRTTVRVPLTRPRS